MKYIGMFFANNDDMIEAYRKHSQSAQNSARDFSVVTVNPSQMTIVIADRKWMYYTFKDASRINDIAGIQFDAIFSEVTDLYCKQYIMSRFRPRFNK